MRIRPDAPPAPGGAAVASAAILPGAELRLTIAGITSSVTSREKDLAFEAPGPIAHFVAPKAIPDIELEAAWDVPADPPGEKVFDSGGVWRLFRDAGRFVFRLHAPRFGGQPYKVATFAPDFTSGVIAFRRDCFDASRLLYPLEYPLDELIVTNWLALGRGVEVHACAVADENGEGYLFAGHSGAGKTTMARQWCEERGISVLSDDRVVLRKDAGRIWMYGTPWHGDEPLASPARAALTRVFVLGPHASRNALTRLTRAQAVARLFACSFPPPFSSAAIDFTLSFLADVAQSVPVFELACVPDPRVRAFIRTAA